MAACVRSPCFSSKSQFFLKKCMNSRSFCTSSCLKSNRGEKEIVIPSRIERGSTDILKALASTISKDFTAPHYKYEDDPYCIPISNVTKRVFALSKESGKKAARYFLEKYPELFKFNTSEPRVKAFDPPATYTEIDDLKESDLEDCIQNSDVKNAIFVHDILQKRGIELKASTQQELLELLCFYNCEEPLPEEYYEERYFRRQIEQRTNSWKGNGVAEKLFQSLVESGRGDGRAYSALICGAAKFKDVERAFTLYDEMRNRNLIGTDSVYNNLLLLVPFVKETGDARWELITDLLNDMNSDGVAPDLHTMNNILEDLSRDYKWNKCKSISLNILSEMKRLNIEPSLGTYHYIIRIFGGYGRSNVLSQVVSQISGQEFHVRHHNDVKFFTTAMEHCLKFYHDKELAYKIHNLLEFKSNSKLLGNSLSESIYFKSFFQVLCESEDFDKYMEVYEKYTPNTYTPEPSVMLSIVQRIHFSGYYHHLPKICSDIILFEQSEREDILCELIEVISSIKHENHKVLVEMVWKIFENVERRTKSGKFFLQWTGQLLGNVLKTFLTGEDLEKAWSIMQKLEKDALSISGYPEKEVLVSFCLEFHKAQEFEKVKSCIKYAVNGCYPDFRADLPHGMLEDEQTDLSHEDGSKEMKNAM